MWVISDEKLKKRHHYNDILKRYLALAKLPTKGYSPHSLRHTFASSLVMSGVDLNTVKNLMGHSSIKQTEKYSHLVPSHIRHATDTLSGYYNHNDKNPVDNVIPILRKVVSN